MGKSTSRREDDNAALTGSYYRNYPRAEQRWRYNSHHCRQYLGLLGHTTFAYIFEGECLFGSDNHRIEAVRLVAFSDGA